MKTTFTKLTEAVVHKGIRTIAPEENCPPVRVRVWVRNRVSFRVERQFSSAAIVLEPSIGVLSKRCLENVWKIHRNKPVVKSWYSSCNFF